MMNGPRSHHRLLPHPKNPLIALDAVAGVGIEDGILTGVEFSDARLGMGMGATSDKGGVGIFINLRNPSNLARSSSNSCLATASDVFALASSSKS